jgi:hypothetical protein
MVRRRADEPVHAVEDGIEEVKIEHRKTSRGIRTKEKTVPVRVAVKGKSGKFSHSKGKADQSGPELVEDPGVAVPPLDNSQPHQYVEERADGFDDPCPDQDQSQAHVCTAFFFI